MEMIYETNQLTIEYKDDILMSLRIKMDGHELTMKYMEDELLECILDEHEMPIEHNKLVGNILGTQYDPNGHLHSSNGFTYYSDNIQTWGYETFYMGKNVKSKYFKYLFRISDLEAFPKFQDSEEMFFLLSFGYGEMMPYNNIANLPPIGLGEFITALGDMLKQGVYLTYMDKVFSGYPSKLILDSNVDLLDKNRTDYIKAKLDLCTMSMVTSNLKTTAVIVDSDNVKHVF